MLEKARALGTALLLLLPLGLAVPAVEAQDDEAFHSYREKLMESNGAHMGAIGDILKYKIPVPSTHIASHAKAINETSKLIAEAFKKQTDTAATDAKPEIWSEWDRFVSLAKALEQESARLAEIAVAGDLTAIMPQVRKLGDACSNCHEPFRKPQEEGQAHD